MNNAYIWYSELVRPAWAPPSWLFAPVWSVLYLMIAISFGTVFYRVYTKKLKRSIALPFFLNLICNFTFTYFQFELRNNVLAALDILLTLFTLLWAINTVKRKLKWVAYMQIPYLLWVTFATILQLTVTYLNW